MCYSSKMVGKSEGEYGQLGAMCGDVTNVQPLKWKMSTLGKMIRGDNWQEGIRYGLIHWGRYIMNGILRQSRVEAQVNGMK